MNSAEFFSKYGFAGVIVLLAIRIVISVGEFLWRLHEKKNQVCETTIERLTESVKKNTIAIEVLTREIEKLEIPVKEVPKLKTDIRRFYLAVKAIAGDRWNQIRDEVLRDDLAI